MSGPSPSPTPVEPQRAADELFLNHPVPLWVYECRSLRFLAVNDAAVATYGYTREQFLEMTVLELRVDTTADDLVALRENPGRRLAWRHSGVCRHRTSSGAIIYAESTAHDLTFEGRPAVAVAAYDITARMTAVAEARNAELQLVESESRYRDLVENLDDVVFAVDSTATISYVSGSVAQFGYSTAELVGHSFAAVVHPADLAQTMASFGDTLLGESRKHEFRIVTKTGAVREVRCSNKVQVRDGVPASVTGVLIDITEQRRAQEHLRTAGRLEAVGRLAGGMAHDFNNLLVAINGFAELAMAQVAPGSPIRDDLSEIIKAGNRAAALTSQLLTFSRSQVLRPDSVGLNEVVTGMEPMLRRLIGEDIDLRISCTPDLPQVRIDAGHLEQVIMNLVVNARDAMPKGGRLTLRTSRDGFPTAELPDGLSPDRVAVVSVADTGHGMDEATQARIFEPFFTTKPIGEGTGLGLAMVYGFVKQSGGAIALKSAPGRGTVFHIALPQEHAVDAPEAVSAPSMRAGSETVLVTEDEVTVRTLVHRLLKEAGYTVLSAAGAMEALKLCREYQGPIDLLLTDVVMPHMSGATLARQATSLRSDMHVLFMSGYSGSEISARGLADSSLALLRKPFSAGELSDAVRSALAARV
ncbi:MAG: PAS domain S-box protein [Vicinamibacterales bacterium]